MIYWAPLLHFYQPTTQLHWVLKKVCNESYRPLVNLFHELPYAEVTVNINAVLTELLDEHGVSDVIDSLRELAEKGRLEFTGSAKYHPILPLIPQEEMLRQIVHNHQPNRRFFGRTYSPQGFFSPEMCYSRDIVKPTLDTGHRWLVEHFHGRYPSWQSIPPVEVKRQPYPPATMATSHDSHRTGKYYADFERR